MEAVVVSFRQSFTGIISIFLVLLSKIIIKGMLIEWVKDIMKKRKITWKNSLYFEIMFRPPASTECVPIKELINLVWPN